MLSELHCGGVVETAEGQEPVLVVAVKPDGRRRRRMSTRKAHRARTDVTRLLESRANAHGDRAKKAHRCGNSPSVLNAIAGSLSLKALSNSRRFHVPVTISANAAPRHEME
ncbi:hypothetical protein AUJ46_02445 [Candidatus Peregrinibacteria bacterium CG1_02_54_53]|nr:MAG: hypothetical protein AUJ46_02445 [Candidatus Peregrinibacteria bacterium CG1_02_54_53]